VATRLSGDKTLLPEMLAIIKTEKNVWLFRSACDAARQLGAKLALAEVLVERLSDEKMADEKAPSNVHWALLGLVMDEPPSGIGSLTRQERLDLQNAWREFLTAHGKEIDAGKTYKIGDDEGLPRALLGNMFWSLPDGQTWPKK